MAEKDIGLEKFCGTTAREWTVWVEDYRIFGGLKKWSEEKLVSNLRFFVTGDVKDCVRQKCGEETPKELDELEKEVARFLGGTPDPISAVKELDEITYDGSIEKLLLQINNLIPLAYPTLQTKEDRQQMVLLQLHKTLPKTYTKELLKSDVKTLDKAKVLISGMERADRSMGDKHTTVSRMVVEEVKVSQNPTRQCFVCGLQDHIKQMCPFKNDICGRCEKRGHLGTMCRSDNRGNGRRPAMRGRRQARPSPTTTAPPTSQFDRPMPPGPPLQQQRGSHPAFSNPSIQYQHLPQHQWNQPPPVGEQQLQGQL